MARYLPMIRSVVNCSKIVIGAINVCILPFPMAICFYSKYAVLKYAVLKYAVFVLRLINYFVFSSLGRGCGCRRVAGDGM